MYQGQFQGQNQGQHTQRRRRRRRRSNKVFMMLVSLLLLATMMVGGTLAYLFTKTDPVNNHFTPSYVNCTVTERFDDGITKTNVNVTNTGDIAAYIRVKLVTYRVNDQGQHIGGVAALPAFTLGSNWYLFNGYYYYTLPVAPGTQPASNLTESMTLTEYTDSDGGKQVVEVMAEAIQSVPAEAVGNSWHVSITPGSVTAYTNG